MDVERFLGLVERLTGTPVKPLAETERRFLSQSLRDDGRQLDCSQLNEFLLLVNKDRMEPPFFDRFFGRPCLIADLEKGVENFQKLAMLCYGNFVHAYRTLSRLRSDDELKEELGAVCKDPQAIRDDLAARTPKILEIEPISREKTYLVGYLSARDISRDQGHAMSLQGVTAALVRSGKSTWEEFDELLSKMVQPNAQPALRALVANYRKRLSTAQPKDFGGYLEGEVIPTLTKKLNEHQNIQDQAARNQDIYLTWDHMDIYFATSMRKRWEFEDLYSFVNDLMGKPALAKLNLRFFDPTQSFTKNRINKGLVESLMLKRAKCTVYSVQDTDTLGKDSELAATLAQGKPVIAYVPSIDIESRTGDLVNQDPVMLQERLRFLIHADEAFTSSLKGEDGDFVRNFRVLEEFERSRIWRSLDDPGETAEFRNKHKKDLARLCRIVAESEKRLYDSRARTLHLHPLGIQVNLETGVANGVLVVRSVAQCADLLERIVTNSLDFRLENSADDLMWYLKEKISDSVYRVVSQDRKLTNCFWNFYRRKP